MDQCETGVERGAGKIFNRIIFRGSSGIMGKLNKKMKQKQSGGGGGGNKQAMQFNHALGQHILKNPLVIQALVEKVSRFTCSWFLVIVKLIFPRPHSATQTPSLRLVPARGT